MPQSQQHLLNIKDRRRQVATLYLRKITRRDIAIELNVAIQTIYRDVTHLKELWQKEMLADPVAVKGLEVAEIRDMEREAASHPGDIGWAGLRLRYKERIAKMLGLDYKDPVPGSSPTNPLYVAPGQIDWENLPDDLAEEMLALNAKILALQPASGGLIIDETGAEVE